MSKYPNKSIVHKHRTIRTITELILYLFEKSDNSPISLQHILHTEYNFPKSTVYYKIRELERKKIIKSLPRTKPKFYCLVGNNIPKIISRGVKSGNIGNTPTSTGTYRLHNLELSYEILKKSKTSLKEKWDLGKWCGSKEKFGDVTARFTTKNLILYLQAYGRTPQEAYVRAISKSNLVIDMIHNKHPDMIINPYPKINRKAHLSVPTPDDIKRIADDVQVSGEGWKIDKSEGEGELEFVDKSPFELINKASSFANLPTRIKILEKTDTMLLNVMENQQKELLLLQGITKTLQTSLQRIVSPFASKIVQSNHVQKTLDLFKKQEEISYIG